MTLPDREASSHPHTIFFLSWELKIEYLMVIRGDNCQVDNKKLINTEYD